MDFGFSARPDPAACHGSVFHTGTSVTSQEGAQRGVRHTQSSIQTVVEVLRNVGGVWPKVGPQTHLKQLL